MFKQLKSMFVRTGYVESSYETLQANLLLREEMVCDTVREVMLSLDILSGMYKFKVIRLDDVGDKYSMMVDVSATFVIGPNKKINSFAAIEVEVANRLAARYSMELRGMYWRKNSDDVFSKKKSPEALPGVADFAETVIEPHTENKFEKIQMRSDEQYAKATSNAMSVISDTQYGDL